jgi:hypothetical protein
MNIEIHTPELEKRLRAYIQSGRFHDAGELLTKAFDALDQSATAELPGLEALRRKNFVELCDPVRGLMEDIDFTRNPSKARPLDL